jgi:hypothetical protein
MRCTRGILARIALAMAIAAVPTSHVFALDDIGLPIHPKAIPSSIVRNSGKGEGTNWIQVTFKANAPYGEVVKYYKEKTGRNVEISQLSSETLMNTLILFKKAPQDQINVNIVSKVGKKATEVEMTRNYVKQ